MDVAPVIPGQGSGVHDYDSPPMLKSWASLYSFVIGELVLLIILFYMVSQFYR